MFSGGHEDSVFLTFTLTQQQQIIHALLEILFLDALC